LRAALFFAATATQPTPNSTRNGASDATSYRPVADTSSDGRSASRSPDRAGKAADSGAFGGIANSASAVNDIKHLIRKRLEVVIYSDVCRKRMLHCLFLSFFLLIEESRDGAIEQDSKCDYD